MEIKGYGKIFDNQYGCEQTECAFYHHFEYYYKPIEIKKTFFGRIYIEPASWTLAHNVDVKAPCYKCKYFEGLNLFQEKGAK